MGECWLAIALSRGPQLRCPSRDAMMSGWTGWSVSAAHATLTGQGQWGNASLRGSYLPRRRRPPARCQKRKVQARTHARDGKNGGTTRRERRCDGQSRSEGLAVDFCPVKLDRNREREREAVVEEGGRSREGKAEKRSRRGRLPSPTANPAVCPELGKGFKHHCLLQNHLWR